MVMSDRPDAWPDALEDVLLAKSAGRGQDGNPESLAQHTWLVLGRLADFIRLRPDLPAQLNRPSLWKTLYWATFLHDFGKAMPPFQRLLRGDQAARDEWGGHRHELFSLAFVDWLAPGLDEDELTGAVAAIVSHHRDRDEMMRLYPTPEAGDPNPVADMLTTVPEIHITGLYEWLVSCGTPWARHLGLDEMEVTPIIFPTTAPPFDPQEAARRVRYWLKRYKTLAGRLSTKFDSSIDLIALRGMILSADHSGSAHAPSLPRMSLSRDKVLGERNLTPYDHQRQAEKTTGSALLIAPTGTGKTEAALLWASRQSESDNAPRLFYTLPYQASMNAMVRRLEKVFGREHVHLQHGRALLATYRWMMEKGEEPQNADAIAHRRRDLARLHYPPVRVFSPYQMLKAMYRLKGYEAQLTDYHDGLFIFDEIHAYEVKRLALILRTIAYLRRYYNARFLVMSATFPRIIREWLADALGETPTIAAAPALYAKFQRHCIRLVEGEILDVDNLARIRDAALTERKTVLVVCNIVARAQEVYDILQGELAGTGIKVMLLHGRFNMRDRQKKESAIRDLTGADNPHGADRPLILVATQVVEVSLDIDLDTIYTEPAPLEALIQRFGRVNRRGKKGIADVHIFTVAAEGQKYIYDSRLVDRTLRVLAREDGQTIDESAVGGWLDEIYEGEIAEEWRANYDAVAAEFDEIIVGALRPFQSDRLLDGKFDEMFDGVEVLPEDLLTDYERLIGEGGYIEAGELLVPLSYRQLAQISQARKRTSEKGERLITVDVPYSPEKGLDLSVLKES